MAASSSHSQKCDVFISFRGEDVRSGFLSHLLMNLDRNGSINTFKDHGIERSRPIGPEILSAIREAKISIVIFSKNYASSKWCLDELAEIHNCFKESNKMVIPIFYDVDPSEVRKQKGEFGNSFMKTCEGKTYDVMQRWKQTLTDVANLAGEHLHNWSDEASMVKKIANDVFNKLLPRSNGFGDFVGIEAHIEAMESKLCLESEKPRMIGIWGQSGIGKSTLGRALFTHLSPKFPLYAFVTYKSTDQDVVGMKLCWEKELLDQIFDKNIKVDRLGMVEQMLKHKKVLIILDDVVDPLFLDTLVGKAEWFGQGSRIIVITQDRQILKGHKIDLSYEVKIPAPTIALTILCRSAFGENSPPEGFKELAEKVARLAGGLPLGLRVMGQALKERPTEEWMELLPRLLKGGIMETLKVSYDRLDKEDKDIFLWIASIFNGMSVKSINDFFGDEKGGVKRLEEKSLIRKTNKKIWLRDISQYEEIIEMHDLLMNLGRSIVREESMRNPGKRRFLTDAKEIEEVLIDQSGTETVLGILFKPLALESDISIDEKSLKEMRNLQFLKIDDFVWQMYDSKLRLPNGLVYLPRKLKYLDWKFCPLKCFSSNFKAEFLVELRMEYSELEKLWEGTQLPSTIRNLHKLKKLEMKECTRLKVLPVDVNLLSLKTLDLKGCSNLTRFPQISSSIEELYLDETAIEEVPCCIEMFQRLVKLSMRRCNKLKNISPEIFRLANLKLVNFADCEGIITVATINYPCETIKGNKVEKRRSNDHWYFNFENCLKLDREARELIIQSSFKWTVVLPGGELPTYFKPRAFGNSLTVTLPHSSFSHKFLRFNVCVVVETVASTCSREPLASTFPSYLHFRFNGTIYKNLVLRMPQMWKNHLVLFSFKFQPTGLTSILDSNDLEFEFEGPMKIKECGIRLLDVSSSPNDRDGRSSEIDVVEIERSNKQMKMKENFNLPCDQIVRDTGLMAPNLELPLGRGESSSSVSLYPCPEEEALCIDSTISEHQDALIPIAHSDPEPMWQPSRSRSSSIFCCWGELLKGIMQMTSEKSAEKSEEKFNLPCDQIVRDTVFISPNLELPLGRGESASNSSYPCLEGEALCIGSMITEEQDAQLPILR